MVLSHTAGQCMWGLGSGAWDIGSALERSCTILILMLLLLYSFYYYMLYMIMSLICEEVFFTLSFNSLLMDLAGVGGDACWGHHPYIGYGYRQGSHIGIYLEGEVKFCRLDFGCFPF